MGSSESDLTAIDNAVTVLSGIAGVIGGITAALGLVSFFGGGASLS
ncbi:hypothetical protein ACFWAD_06770 [Rhodococcus sp. NPDC059969]